LLQSAGEATISTETDFAAPRRLVWVESH